MWFNADEFDLSNIRHDCEERDKLDRYGWLLHDGRGFGLQELLDPRISANLTTQFLAQRDGSWTARVIAQPLSSRAHEQAQALGVMSKTTNVSLIWYVALEDSGMEGSIESATKKGIDGGAPVELSVRKSRTSVLPAFTLQAHGHPDNKFVSVSKPAKQSSGRSRRSSASAPQVEVLDKTYFLAAKRDRDDAWNVKDSVERALTADMKRLLMENYKALEKAHEEEVQKNGGKPKPRSQEQVTEELMKTKAIARLPNTAVAKGANVFAFQQVLQLPFTFDFVFTPQSSADDEEDDDDDDTVAVDANADDSAEDTASIEQEQQQSSTHDFNKVTRRFATAAKNATARFDRAFPLSRYTDEQRAFARAALSNLVGGIGHFFGRARHETDPMKPPEFTAEYELLTAVPSRSFFPRGFLWDEGFHQLLVSRFDAELSLAVLRSWLARMDDSGWIPREQIPGSEARRRVPEEFQVQRPSVANPPTLFLAIRSLLDARKKFDEVTVEVPEDAEPLNFARRVDSAINAPANPVEEGALVEFLQRAVPKLERHVNWFFWTQHSFGADSDGPADSTVDITKARTFRWRGRSLDHCLASGLDDYPRAPWLTTREGHVDLHSWMVFMTRTLGEIFRWLSEHATNEHMRNTWADKAAEFDKRADALWTALNEEHWHDELQMYGDYAAANGTRHFIQNEGYVSLFPFLLGLVPAKSPKLGAILTQMRAEGNPRKLWSPWGLRSLAQDDDQFGTKENYWRGPIWININYLAVRALQQYSERAGPYKAQAAAMHKELRTNLVNNLFNEYKRTGYLWEQYSPTDGKGRRSHPFTGWSALVVLMMADG